MSSSPVLKSAQGCGVVAVWQVKIPDVGERLAVQPARVEIIGDG
ncbi:hypothetical protein [Xanthomonas cerealis]|nr:hypothetical protein [Xanthomonas translucens]